MPEVAVFLQFGRCASDTGALFLRLLARLPVDVLLLLPNLNEGSALHTPDLLEVHCPQSVSLDRFPVDQNQARVTTAAYQAEKVRRNCMDFSDQEHYAIRLLQGDDGAPTPLGRQLSGRYREIMVDEYQDTNEVQNCIFRAISRDGQNLFTVGDVKQSIYRFRLADPTIFLEKYLAYRPAEEAEEGQPRKVLLSQNFRSRPQVIRSAVTRIRSSI